MYFDTRGDRAAEEFAVHGDDSSNGGSGRAQPSVAPIRSLTIWRVQLSPHGVLTMSRGVGIIVMLRRALRRAPGETGPCCVCALATVDGSDRVGCAPSTRMSETVC